MSLFYPFKILTFFWHPTPFAQCHLLYCFFLMSSLIKIERRILEISLKRRYIEEAPFAKSERPCQLSIWKAFQKGPIRSCASLIMYFLGWILMETKEERWILEKRDCCKGRAKFPNADQSRSTWANLHGVPKICFHGQVFLSFKLWWVQPRYRSALEPKKENFGLWNNLKVRRKACN